MKENIIRSFDYTLYFLGKAAEAQNRGQKLENNTYFRSACDLVTAVDFGEISLNAITVHRFNEYMRRAADVIR